MKTIIVNQPGDVQVIERDMPVRKPGEALLKVLYGGICGSDLGTYRGTFAYADYHAFLATNFLPKLLKSTIIPRD